MSVITKNYVNYYPIDGYFVVGDNSTSNADGINDTSYSGEIVIEEKINGKEVLEISKNAFSYCIITKATIHAKLRSINLGAFCYCEKIEYLNIPSTVTFLGSAAIWFGYAKNLDLQITIEFVKGRTQKIFFDMKNFARRKTYNIIYPSTYAPLYSSTVDAFLGVENYQICAPSSFAFYTKSTTAEQSKCPPSQYKGKTSKICTCITKRKQQYFILNILICFSSSSSH